jgi:hypothetical protein
MEEIKNFIEEDVFDDDEDRTEEVDELEFDPYDDGVSLDD